MQPKDHLQFAKPFYTQLSKWPFNNFIHMLKFHWPAVESCDVAHIPINTSINKTPVLRGQCLIHDLTPKLVHLQWTVDGWCDPGYTANHMVALLAVRVTKLLSSFAAKMLLQQLLLGSSWFVKHLGEIDLSRTILMKLWQSDGPAHKLCFLLTL